MDYSNRPNHPVNKSFPLSIIVLILLIRALTLNYPDLIEPTESRYATIPLIMLQKSDWLIPRVWIDGQLEPYFSKPPLHFWLIAICYKLIYVDEWVARLPSFFAMIALLIIVYALGKRAGNSISGILSALICSTSLILFFLSGAVVTDVSLTAAITLALLGFVFFETSETERSRTYWGLLIFTGAAISFMIKGPLGSVLIAGTIFLYLLIQKDLGMLKKLPWLRGTLLYLVIIVPWLLMAQSAYPDFFHYYFIQENLGRFLNPSFGSRYGGAHNHSYGAIWYMLPVAFIPWVFLLLGREYRVRFSNLLKKERDSVLLFFTIAGVLPAVFFTFSRNILGTYCVLSIPGLALATGYLVSAVQADSADKALRRRYYVITAMAAVSALTLGMSLLHQQITFASIITLLVLLASFLLNTKHKSLLNYSTVFVSYLSLHSAILFSALIVLLSPYVNNRRSLEPLMKEIANNTPGPVLSVGVADHFEQSAFWLAGAGQHEISKKIKLHVFNPNKLSEIKVKNVVIKLKRFKSSDYLKAHYTVRKIIGKWAWLVRSNELSKNNSGLSKEKYTGPAKQAP
ncbi:MAG: glycosyltransferase family 39 protein [Candidatus Dadabacteria bacterium]|nr:MAG: glycosyltransferase family 39 protein [Candidatus Dadabacteria bacterium]